ncbi:saccharopine dehydrogenase NADP-binding domain-containing protein [Rickettsiella endosymbiont of Aleochara curtula]|uniref:saccharopine dehydrogenase NADP-binding domain-containing protein n=1 Tax=Rickettsiella endosymbiont of Aleochara curtula TaxID=3077936 RepID=UPI00313E3642
MKPDEDNKVLILGATGNFGRKIAKGLVKKNVAIIISGRHEEPLLALKKQLSKVAVDTCIDILCFDFKKRLSQELLRLRPPLVINASGPFQTADFTTAINCILLGINYIDLADAREYVNDFSILDEQANKRNCIAITGASTLPCLSSAVLDYYKDEFKIIDSLVYGITLGQKTERGLATFKGILSYVGRRLQDFPGIPKKVYGWQDLYRQEYPLLGKRWMANCDVPDLELLPGFFPIKSIRFSAGIESSMSHLGLWFLSWLIRLKFPIKLANHAETLLKFSHYFDSFGTDAGGMHMLMSGTDHKGNHKDIKWFMIAKSGDGPYIPTIPAILLAKRILQEEIVETGAITAMNLISLESYLAELKKLDIHIFSEVSKKF